MQVWVMEEILADGMEKGLIVDATIADSIEQGKMYWRIRELFGERMTDPNTTLELIVALAPDERANQ